MTGFTSTAPEKIRNSKIQYQQTITVPYQIIIEFLISFFNSQKLSLLYFHSLNVTTNHVKKLLFKVQFLVYTQCSSFSYLILVL